MEPVPLVIVEGFLSSAGAVLWGNFERHSNHASQLNGEQHRRTIFASVGPVSSLHDRACELFYSLIGGTVDYGHEHSREHKHSRYGRTYDTGLYPEWSEDRPLHFLGHSMGGPTITKLQWLLSTGHFGKAFSPHMILSVNTVSSPFRGTQLVYSLGEDTNSAPNVRPLSPGDLLAKAVHLAAYLSPVLPRFLDLHADARALSFRDTSLRSFMGQLWKSDWAESRDATPYDATFEAADERESLKEGAVNPKTYYRSYCATLVKSDGLASDQPRRPDSWLSRAMAWPFHLSCSLIAAFDFSSLRPIPAFISTVASASCASRHGSTAAIEDGVLDVARSGDYLSFALRENDGVVPLFSQWHPFECKSTRCRHFSHGDNILDQSKSSRYDRCPDAGIWHVHHLAESHHFSIVPFWFGTQNQKAFWLDIGHWLRAVDRAHRGGMGATQAISGDSDPTV